MPIKYQNFIDNNYKKNRTIVSKDIETILLEIEKLCDSKMTIHRFPSGADIGTWIIPDSWDVNEAWIKGPDGNIIASYDDHPLFLAPYSIPFHGKVSLDELREHIRVHPSQNDAYYYEFRLAYNYPLRMTDWVVSLPADVNNALPEGQYEVNIDVETKPSEMLVGEIVLEGEQPESIALLTDYCHPGQVNDSFSGILAMIDVIKHIRASGKPKLTYIFFIFPETIGSCVLLASNPDYIKTIRFYIFSEMVGWGNN